MHRRVRNLALAFALGSMLCLVLGTGTAAADYVAYAVTKQGELALPESIDGIKHEELIRMKWGEYNGPQTRLAVLEVDNDSATSSFSMRGPDGSVIASYSVSDIERQVPVNGIEAMISGVLHESGRFRMMERQVLNEVLSEQDLGASGRVAQPSAAKMGKVLGAQFLIQAVVTSYEPNFKGKKFGLGGITKGLLGGAKVGKQKSMIGMNFRLIDAETGELVFAKQVDVVVGKNELGLGGVGWGSSGALGGMFSTFSKTPIGQAVMAGINIGTYELVKQIGSAPAQGSVIKVDGTKVYVNMGGDGVEVGGRLKALAKGEELIDPDTGISLGGEEELLGMLKINSVQEKFSIAEPVDFDASRLQRGDKIVSTEGAAPLQFASTWEGKKAK